MTFLKVPGLMTKLMAKAFMFISMVFAIMANGKWTSNMAKGKKFGQTKLFTKVILIEAKNTVPDHLNGTMVPNTLDNSEIIKSLAKEYLPGKIIASMKVLGSTIEWKEKVNSLGWTAEII